MRFAHEAKGFTEISIPPIATIQSGRRFIIVMMFSELVLEHFRSPHNAGDLASPTAIVEVTNPVCGDVLRLSVRLERGIVSVARFKTQGCVAAIASSSVLTDLVTGKSLVQLRGITADQISAALGGLPPTTYHAAHLCADAVEALLLKLP
jgi:nitrogen fixation protein NifU and related proteins